MCTMAHIQTREDRLTIHIRLTDHPGATMAEETFRYAVVFRDDAVPHELAKEILAGPQVTLTEIKQADLQNGTSCIAGNVHFSEIGVAYLDLDERSATALSTDLRISSVHRVRELLNGGHLVSIETARPVVADRLMAAEGTPPSPGLPWNVTLVRANQVWSRTTGQGVKVAVLDNGINRHRTDLVVADGISFVPGISDWDDDDGHGTHCAGIIAANAPNQGVMGVAPGCTLYAVKVMTRGAGNTDWVVAGMMWAAQNKMDVVSMSLWETSGASAPDEAPWDDVQRAAQFLLDSGCLVVGIAGNSGNMGNHWVTKPGRCPAVMAVGAVDDQSAWWDESSFGPPELPIVQAVELTAPGVAIKSTYLGDGFSYYSGTSMACPHIAGAAALMKSLDPAVSTSSLREKLRVTARDLGPPGLDEKYGAGLLDCLSAIS
jgi:subtilisin family serine protease